MMVTNMMMVDILVVMMSMTKLMMMIMRLMTPAIRTFDFNDHHRQRILNSQACFGRILLGARADFRNPAVPGLWGAESFQLRSTLV